MRNVPLNPPKNVTIDQHINFHIVVYSVDVGCAMLDGVPHVVDVNTLKYCGYIVCILSHAHVNYTIFSSSCA